jgi:hypothetical protein
MKQRSPRGVLRYVIRHQRIIKSIPARERRLGRYGGSARPAKSVSGHAASKHKTHIRLSIFPGPGGFLHSQKSVMSVTSAHAASFRSGRQTISIVSTRERAMGSFHNRLKEISTLGDSGISGIYRESGYQTRLCANENQRETHPMTKRLLLSMSVILSTAITAPVFAQAVVREPDAYALYLPRVGPEIESAPSQRRDAPIVSYGTDDVTASAPSARPWRAGNETAIRPWSAPVGHHQPRAADVSARRLFLSRSLIRKTRTSTA